MAQKVIYGIGGFDADAADNNVIEVIDLPDVVDEQELARQSAIDKLSKLGLTEAEVLAIISQ